MQNPTYRFRIVNGFTMIEIIIVLAIISILATLAVPRLVVFIEQAKISDDKQLAAIVANAGAAYVASYGEDPSFVNSDVSMENLYNSDLIRKQYTSSDLQSTIYTDIELNYDGNNVRCTLDGDVDYIVVK